MPIPAGVFDAIEKIGGDIVSHVKPGGIADATKGFVNFADHIFSFRSALTGKSGAYINDWINNVNKPAMDEGLAMATHEAKTTGKIDLANGKGPQTATPELLRAKAAKYSRVKSGGENDSRIAGMIAAVNQEHGPVKAGQIADHFGTFFHEQANSIGAINASRSTLATNLAKNPLTKDLTIRPSQYTRPEALERAARATSTAAFASLAAVPHLATPLNVALNNRASSFFKTLPVLFGHDLKGKMAQLSTMNGMGQLMSEEWIQDYKFQNGLIHKFAPGSVGEFLHQNIMMLGFRGLRRRAIISATMAGELDAKSAAFDLGNPDKVRTASIELRQLGIDPAEVAANKYELLPKHIQQARFRSADNSLHLQPGLYRSKAGSNTPAGRLLLQFHNYAAAQGNMILRSLKVAKEKGDFAGWAKTIAMLGLVYPTAGNMVYELRRLARGQDWQGFKAVYDTVDREKAMYGMGPHGAGEMFFDNIDAFSHTAGLGVMTGYVQAGTRFQIAQALIGPIGDAAANIAQDAIHPLWQHHLGKKGSLKPLVRDILHDAPSMGLGAVAANQFIPTTAQAAAGKPKTIKQLKAAMHKRKPRADAGSWW